MIKVVSRKLYFFSAILFFLFALYSLAGRYVVTTVPSYKPILEAWLSQQLNVPIKIGKLEARWEIMNPSVYATDIHIDTAGGSSTQGQKDFPYLQQIKLSVNLLSSLWHHDLRLRGLAIQGLDITLEKKSSGQLHLVGVPMSSTPFELSRWIDSILSQQHISLNKVSVHYRTATQAYELSTPQMILGKDGSEYQLSARMQLKQQKNPLQFLLVAQGKKDISSFLGWRGKFYVKLKPSELGAWIAQWHWQELQLEHLNLGSEIWGGVEGNTSWAQGFLHAENIELHQLTKNVRKIIPRLSARVQWRQADAKNWRVLVDALNMQYANHRVSNERVFVAQTSHEAKNNLSLSWQVQASRLPVPWLFDAAPFVSALNDHQKIVLQALQPQGELTEVNLLLSSDSIEKIKLTHFNSRFSQLASQAYENIPGFSGLNGFLSGNLKKGVVHVGSQNFTLDLKDIFRWPVSAQSVSANLRWFTDDKRQLQLESGLLKVLTNGAQGRGLLSLTFPAQGSAVLRLNASAWNGDGRDTPKYLPTKAMSSGLVNWLDTAILSGHLAEGNFLFNGSVAPEASLENRRHTFQMRYQVDQAELNYAPPWPKLFDVTADALILGREAEIQLKKGRIEQNSNATGVVTVPYFSSAEIPHLQVAAQVRSNAADGVHVLQTSPLRRSLSSVVDSLRGQGPVDIQLNLDIPLEEVSPHFVAPKIDVDVNLNKVELNLKAANLAAQDLQGKVKYRENTGLQAPQLTGFLLGKPVVAHIATKQLGRSSHTQVDVSGIADIFALQRWQPNPAWIFLKGETPYQARLVINSARKMTSGDAALEIHSNLIGVAVNLPKPLAKLAEEEKLFNYRMTLSGSSQSIQWNFGQEIKAMHLKNAQGDIQGQIALGNSLINHSLKPGISVLADFDQLDVEPWLKLMKESQKNSSFSHYGDVHHWPKVDVRLASVKMGDKEWGAWHVQAQPFKEGVQINSIDGQINALHVQGQGSWNVLDQGVMHFEGTAEAPDISKVMRAWGYTPSATSEQAKTTIDVTWPGGPANASWMNMVGKFDVTVMRGKLLDVEGASSIKAVSLFNVQNLQRRLQLDFSDLFKKGISYDQMNGHFDLAQGILSTPQFSITGPSLQFSLRGKAHLEKHELDQQVELTLPVARNLVIPAAVVGGLPAAATVYVIDKALGASLNKLTTFHFKLEGDWDKPKVTQHLFKENP